MINRSLVTLAALSFGVAMVFGAALLWHASQARSLGSFTQSFSGGACQHPMDGFTRQLVTSRNDVQSVYVYLINKGKSACRITLRLEAPHFQPSSDAKVVSLAAGEKRAVTWLLTPPEKLGDFQVKFSAALDEAIVGVRVTSVLGLSAAWAEFVTLVGTILGASGVTIPWLYAIYAARRRRDPAAEGRAA